MSSHNFKRTKTTIANKNLNENNNNKNDKTSSSRSTFHVKTYSMAPTTETLNSSIDYPEQTTVCSVDHRQAGCSSSPLWHGTSQTPCHCRLSIVFYNYS